MAEPRKQINTRIPASIKQRLEVHARSLGLSETAVITLALDAYLPKLPRKRVTK